MLNIKTMSKHQHDHSQLGQQDPVYQNSWREARLILIVWTCCFLYTTSYCYLYGYLVHEPSPQSTGGDVAELFGPLSTWNRQGDSVTYPLGLGIPEWVFYGVALPWLIAIMISIGFCLFVFREDDLSPLPAPHEDRPA